MHLNRRLFWMSGWYLLMLFPYRKKSTLNRIVNCTCVKLINNLSLYNWVVTVIQGALLVSGCRVIARQVIDSGWFHISSSLTLFDSTDFSAQVHNSRVCDNSMYSCPRALSLLFPNEEEIHISGYQVHQGGRRSVCVWLTKILTR